MPAKADYAKIAIACKELGLDRKQFLADRYNVESMKELNPRQLSDLYRHFRSLGWVPGSRKSEDRRRKNRKQEKGFVYLDGPAKKQQRKIMGLWKDLGYQPEAIHTRVKKQFGVDRLHWLTDHDSLHILITDLEFRIQRSEDRKQNSQSAFGGNNKGRKI